MYDRPIRGASLALVMLALTLMLGTPRARAETDMAGKWTAGTTSMKVSIESWGSDCGRRPSSSDSKGGGTVTVSQDGRHLTIHSGGRQIRTGKCWSHNPAMKRLSSSYLDRVWTTVCKTPSNDPREERGNYKIKALTDNKLLYRDVSRYNWKLKDSSCVATITTMQTLSRQVAATGATAAKKPAPPRVVKTCVPGAAAKVTLRPRKAVVQLGGQQCFRAKVTDANGCPIPGSSVRLSLAPGALSAQMHGSCFQASANAAEGEGRFTLRAVGAGFRAAATIEVKSMDLSALIAKNIEGVSADEEEAPPPALSAPEKPEPTPDNATVAARTVPQEGGGGGGLAAIAIAAVLLLGGGFFMLRKRAQPVASSDTEDSWQGQAGSPAPAPAAQPQPQAPTSTAPPSSAQQLICRTCRRGYPPGTAACTHCPPADGELVPYSEFVDASKKANSTKRRCTDCGVTWDKNVNFCGDCGGKNLVDA